MTKISDLSILNAVDENKSEPVVSQKILNIGNWVVVKFEMEETSGVRKFIGQILSFDDDGRVCIDFLRGKNTSQFSGYV